MNSLTERVIAEIEHGGPITIARFMEACLYDPLGGYYATRPLLGGEGADFMTAPEASQMFGELIGMWCVHEWGILSAPAPFQLIELGPGRGLLMEDVLRAAARQPAFNEAARVTFVETSQPLRREQALRVPGAAWADELSAAPDGPQLILGNEFLDCLPIRQFVSQGDAWRERLLGAKDGALTLGLGPALPKGVLPEAPAGWVHEDAPGLSAVIAELARRLKQHPGRALLIDYGYATPEGADTLQAMAQHRQVDPFKNLGEADMTALVDFEAVARLARAEGLDVAGPISQGAFLRSLGLDERAEALANKNPSIADRIEREYLRLAAPDEMGELFLVICLSSPGLPAPAGFPT